MPWAHIHAKGKFDGFIFCGEGGLTYEGAYIREEKHFNLESVKLITFLSFFQICNNQQPLMVRITFI